MIEIVPYRESWPAEFEPIGQSLRALLGDKALAIHHIGSTSVPGLPAKDVIDVQITVSSLEPSLIDLMMEAGYPRWRAAEDHCPPGMTLPPEELTKFLGGAPGRRTHVHMREAGRFNQRYPLLCRDYLRAHPLAAAAYGRIKEQLARYFPEDVEAYYDVKDPVFDLMMASAEEWAQWTGWELPPSDV